MTKKETILIFGNGQLGNFYKEYFDTKSKYEVKIANVDITDIAKVEMEVKKFNPTVVINTAAKTNLEYTEKNKLEAFNVNVLGANNIAKVCDEKNAYYIFLSSGCIFESMNKKDIKNEESNPNPSSYYAWTKVWAEELIQYNKSRNFKALILRPRQPVSAQINYKNMLVKFLTFTKFIDTLNSGTVIEDLMVWTEELMQKRVTGIVHVANVGFCTPYKIALLLKKYVLPELKVEMITKKELDLITPVRRVDTILNVNKLKKLVKEVKTYEESLENLVVKLAKNFKNTDKKEIKKQLLKTIEQTKLRATPNDVWQTLFK
jgi:dTDP-4-dehydrorhamnose reductase